jgi:glycosyltransferase involved in cell wall biosynthesis
MATPPRVLVLSEIPTPYRLPLYRLLQEAGRFAIDLVFLAEGEPDRPWVLTDELEGIPHRVLTGRKPTVRTRRNTFVYEVNPGIFKLLHETAWDAIVVGGYAVFAEQIAIAYACATGTPYVLHSESHLGKPRGGALRAAKRAILPKIIGGAAAGLATGAAAARYLAEYGLDPGLIRIVPNTVDVERYRRNAAMVRADAAGVRARRSLPEHYVLYAGRLVEAKGLLDLLAALQHLGPEAPTVVVAGEGPLSEALAASNHVHLVGFQDEERLIELYALADAFVLPSHDEPWGVVVNEALACQTPVIVSSAVGAAEDLVVSGRNGLIFPTRDVDALATALSGPYPSATGGGRIDRWTYEFGVEQFVEGLSLALR